MEDTSLSLVGNKISPKGLIRLQVDSSNKFRRWDTLIRCIAAEYYIKNGTMHPLYKKDCDLRWFYIHKSYDTYNTDITKGYFEKSIESFMSYGGFDEREPLGVDKNLILFDGTHRLGIALAMNLDCVFVKKTGYEFNGFNADYSYYKERFTEDELKLIKDKYDEVIC